MTRRKSVWAAFGITALALSATPAHAVDWAQSYFLQSSGGITNPGVLVGFNPQPEPPAYEYTPLNTSNANEPTLTIPGQSAGTFFDVFVALDLPGGPSIVLGPDPTPFGPDPSPFANFATYHLDANNVLGGRLFDVFLDFSTSHGGIGDGLSAVAFNPQPEPPAFGANADAGLHFTFTGFSDVTVGLRIQDAEGNPLALAAVPEPATLGIFALSLAGLAWRRSRR